MSSSRERKIISLREDESNISVKGLVIESGEPRVVETRKGPRTLSEAIIGDETGRIKVTLWGKHAGTLKEGQAVRIEGGWTTSFKGKVQLNVGSRSNIEVLEDSDVPSKEEIPEDMPQATRAPRASGRWQGSGRGQRSPGRRRSWY